MTMHLQRAGRMTRYQEGKTGMLIDLTVGKSEKTPGNSIMHGLVGDEGRTWSLDGGMASGKVRKGKRSKTRTCGECLAMFPASLTACPQCGAEPSANRQITELDIAGC